MIKSILLSLFLGAIVGRFATSRSGQAAGLMLGLVSATGFFLLQQFTRSRLRGRQGAPPDPREGETPVLHGPAEWFDDEESYKVWLYLSNQRLTVNEESGSMIREMELRDIEELRPLKENVFGGEFSLVSKGQGMLKLKMAGAKRWHATLQLAMNPQK